MLIKDLAKESEFKEAYETNKQILKDDKKFRTMFQKVVDMKHNWKNWKLCDCKLCIIRREAEIQILKDISIDNVIEFRQFGKIYFAKVLNIEKLDAKEKSVNIQIEQLQFKKINMIFDERWITFTRENEVHIF